MVFTIQIFALTIPHQFSAKRTPRTIIHRRHGYFPSFQFPIFSAPKPLIIHFRSCLVILIQKRLIHGFLMYWNPIFHANTRSLRLVPAQFEILLSGYFRCTIHCPNFRRPFGVFFEFSHGIFHSKCLLLADQFAVSGSSRWWLSSLIPNHRTPLSGICLFLPSSSLIKSKSLPNLTSVARNSSKYPSNHLTVTMLHFISFSPIPSVRRAK